MAKRKSPKAKSRRSASRSASRSPKRVRKPTYGRRADKALRGTRTSQELLKRIAIARNIIAKLAKNHPRDLQRTSNRKSSIRWKSSCG